MTQNEQHEPGIEPGTCGFWGPVAEPLDYTSSEDCLDKDVSYIKKSECVSPCRHFFSYPKWRPGVSCSRNSVFMLKSKSMVQGLRQHGLVRVNGYALAVPSNLKGYADSALTMTPSPRWHCDSMTTTMLTCHGPLEPGGPMGRARFGCYRWCGGWWHLLNCISYFSRHVNGGDSMKTLRQAAAPVSIWQCFSNAFWWGCMQAAAKAAAATAAAAPPSPCDRSSDGNGQDAPCACPNVFL